MKSYRGRIVAKSSHDQHDPERGFVRYITGDVIEMTPREKAWLVNELGHVELVPDDTQLSAGSAASDPQHASDAPDPDATAYHEAPPGPSTPAPAEPPAGGVGAEGAPPDPSTQPPASDEALPSTDPPAGDTGGDALLQFADARLAPQARAGLAKAGIEEAQIATLPDDTLLAISGIADRSLAVLRELYGGPPEEGD